MAVNFPYYVISSIILGRFVVFIKYLANETIILIIFSETIKNLNKSV